MPQPSPEELPDPKYTLEGLPVVSKENLQALVHLNAVNQDRYQESFEDRLERENPEIFRLIDDIATSGEFSEDYIGGLIYGALLAYESLRRQLATNKLENEVDDQQPTT